MTITYTDTDVLSLWFGYDATRLTPNALDKAHSMMFFEIAEMKKSIPTILQDTGIDYSGQAPIEWVQAYRIWKRGYCIVRQNLTHENEQTSSDSIPAKND